jgi:transcriptional regulator with XRE-family HTH domain
MMLTREVVRLVRIASGMTQQELADRIGISRGYLSQMEIGARPLATKQAELLRELWGLSDRTIEELLKISEEVKQK